MKDRRKVIIKNEVLRGFRNNLRALLYKLFIDKHNRYSEESIKILNRVINKEDLRDKEVIEDEINTLNTLGNKLRQVMNKSIIECQRCHKTDRDMAFFADWEKWYCIECFEKNYTAWKKQIEKQKDPDYPFQ